MPLELYADYDRRAVHDIFDPASPFTVGAGSWGLRGILRVPDRPGDFVLFVTLGKRGGTHQFDESINDEGVLRWESELKQDLSSPAIRELIAHDPHLNAVHLFLRTAPLRNGVAPPFTYLGPLRYAGHDADRAQPAHVAWELIAWPIPEGIREHMRLDLVREATPSTTGAASLVAPSAAASGTLVEEEPPSSLAPLGEPSTSFQARKRRYQSSDQSRALGLAGELLVLDRERSRLVAAGRPDLAALVEHTSIVKGDGAGFDIASFFSDGRPKFIEVKTTTGPKNSDFLISPNEIAFSEAHAASFELSRLFAYDQRLNAARSYSLWGNMKERLALQETQYRARPIAA